MSSDSEQDKKNETGNRVGQAASNVGNREVRKVQNDVSAEMRQRFGFLSRFTNMFRK